MNRTSNIFNKNILYLDWAATTPVAPEVLKAMQPYFSQSFGNPNSVHDPGRRANAALDMARKTMAEAFGVDFRGVVFVASATEANNLALRGLIKRWKQEHPDAKSLPHIITTKIEHASVLDTCTDLERTGEAEVTFVGVGRDGVVRADDVARHVTPNTVCVSMMLANNVTGAIQPVDEVVRAVVAYREAKLREGTRALRDLPYPFVHTDAAQAFCASPVSIRPQSIPADFITVCSHKINGPKGAAALIMANSVSHMANRKSAIGDWPFAMSSLITGGGQEFGVHSGTQNVPAIVGFRTAFERAIAGESREQKRMSALRAWFVKELVKIYPRAVVNSPERAVAHILNVSFPGFSLDELLYRFDAAAIAISIGSACHAQLVEPSHVLEAMGVPKDVLRSAIRFSFGSGTTKQDLEEACKRMKETVLLRVS